MRAGEVWQQLGDGIFRRRYEAFDQNIGAVLGAEALLVVDTRSHPLAAGEVISDLNRLTTLPVGWVFNTHYHFDHTFGNQCFSPARLFGHVNTRRELMERGEEKLDGLIAEYPQHAEALREVVITPPTETFEDRATIDLGGRVVEMSFLGLGHTNSDAVLHVDGVTFAGDLIEEGAPPGFGDSFPISWFETIGRLAAEARPMVVPGHGDVVDVEYLVVARFDLGWIADQARRARTAGLALEQIALDGAPYPEDYTRDALARAYSELDSKFSQ
ncbi:MAG: MBL fold metallo-hydrolase [Acidimicrobiia bacterium]